MVPVKFLGGVKHLFFGGRRRIVIEPSDLYAVELTKRGGALCMGQRIGIGHVGTSTPSEGIQKDSLVHPGRLRFGASWVKRIPE